MADIFIKPVAVGGDPKFPFSLVIDVPFPTARLAAVARQALSVDKELSPTVRRSFAAIPTACDCSTIGTTGTTGTDDSDDTDDSLKTLLRITYEATTNRMLRVSVNAFLDSLGLVVEVMEGLDEAVLEAEFKDDNNQIADSLLWEPTEEQKQQQQQPEQPVT